MTTGVMIVTGTTTGAEDDRGRDHNDRKKPGRDGRDRYDHDDDRYDDRGRRQ
ncbi:MAG: hypothetical protein ACYC7L_13405 [Nitrospirota bacterium]